MGLNGRLCLFSAHFAGFSQDIIEGLTRNSQTASRSSKKVRSSQKLTISPRAQQRTGLRSTLSSTARKTGRISAVRASPSLVCGSIESQQQETRLGRLGMSRGAQKGPRDTGSRSRALGDSGVPWCSAPHHYYKGGSASPSVGPGHRGLPGPAPARGLAPTHRERPWCRRCP